MKKYQLLFLSLVFALSCAAETVYETGFENSAETNGWTFINGNLTNHWMIGSGTYDTGSQSMYITNNGSSPAYSIASASCVWAYKTIRLDAGKHYVSFRWKAYGESSYDYLCCYLVPTSSGLPTASSTVVPSGAVLSSTQLNLSTAWTTYTNTVTITTPGTYNLYFMWRNNASSGSSPGACVDNITVGDDDPRTVFLPIMDKSQISNLDSCQVVFVNEYNSTTWYAPYYYSTNSYLKPESCKSTTFFNSTYDTMRIDMSGTYKRDVWVIYKNDGDGSPIRSYANSDQYWGSTAATQTYMYTYSKASFKTYIRTYDFIKYASGRFSIRWKGMIDPTSTQTYLKTYSSVYFYNTSYYYNGDSLTTTPYTYRIYRRANKVAYSTKVLSQYVNCDASTQYVFDNTTLPNVTINAAYSSILSVDGWYNKEGNKVGNPGDNVPITKDETLTLRLTSAVTGPYTITYDMGYYGTAIPSETVTNGLTLPSATLKNTADSEKITFLGWYDSTGNYVGQAGDSINVYTDMTLKMLYSAINDPSKTYFKRVKTKQDLTSTSEMNVIFVNTLTTSAYYAPFSYNQLESNNTVQNMVNQDYTYYTNNGASTTEKWVSLANGEFFEIDLNKTSAVYDNNLFIWKITGADSTRIHGYNGYWSSYPTSSKLANSSYPYLYTRQLGYNGGTYDQYILRFNIIPSETPASSLIEWADWDNASYRFIYDASGSSFRAGSSAATYRQWDIYRQAHKVTFGIDDELSTYGSAITEDCTFDSITLPAFNFEKADYANNVTLLGWVDENGNVYQPGEKIEVTRNTDFHMTYTIKKYTVTFDAGEHGTCATTSVTSLLPFALPEIECESGYYFQGWASSINDKIVGQGGSTYPNGANTLTYDDDLYAVYQQSYEVMEWGKNSVTLEFLYGATTAETKTTNGTTLTNTLANCEVDKGIYRLQVNSGDLSADEGLELQIVFKDATGAIVSQAVTKIPVIVSTSENIANEHDYSVCAQTDLVIVNGGVATAGSTPYSFKNIRIQAGGKLVVPTGTSLSTENIYMTAGYVNDGTYQFLYPQLVANGSISNTSGKIMYDYWMNEAQYYNLALPYDVNVADVKYQNGKSLPLNTNLWVAVYNGATRATGASGWENFSGTQFKAGIGYTVAATPQTVRIVGGSAVQRKYAIARFPMVTDLTSGETSADKSTQVVSYPSQTGKDNDAGWNLVGNPFLANYGGSVNGLSNSNGIGLLVDDGEGGYDWQGKVRYVVMPNDNGTSYLPVLATGTALPAFKNFFIQIGAGDALNFAVANRAQKAPMRLSAEEEPADMTTGIVLTRNNYYDPVGIVIGANHTSAYEINADLQKWNNTNGFNFYAIASSEHLSFIAVDSILAQNISLGYSVPEYGTYTISADTTYDNADVAAIYLTDSKKNVVTNLLLSSYKFSLGAAETNNTRFSLSVVKKNPGTATCITNSTTMKCFATSENSQLTLHALPLDEGHLDIYNVIGQKVVSTKVSQDNMSFALPIGTYVVSITSNLGRGTIKAIVK